MKERTTNTSTECKLASIPSKFAFIFYSHQVHNRVASQPLPKSNVSRLRVGCLAWFRSNKVNRFEERKKVKKKRESGGPLRLAEVIETSLSIYVCFRKSRRHTGEVVERRLLTFRAVTFTYPTHRPCLSKGKKKYSVNRDIAPPSMTTA